MILVGDIGNSETKICLVNNKNKIIQKISFNTKKINYKNLNKSLNTLNLKKKSIEKVLFCSVVPSSFNFIKKFLYKKYFLKVYELKELNIEKLIKIKVNKNQIGSDRLANSISVSNNKKNFIVLDFGTATTFDVIIQKIYYGGVIAPGLKLSLETLIDKAQLIPKLDLKKTEKIIGLNTKSAVRSGFFWGYRGLIDNIINLIIKETGKSFTVISTGGFSLLSKNLSNKKIIINKDITIIGLIKASKLIK